MTDLRQRRRENQTAESTVNLSERPRLPYYKSIGRYTIIVGLLIVCVATLFASVQYLKIYLTPDGSSDAQFYSAEIVHLFRKYDRNADNHLSMDEFEAIIYQLENKQHSSAYLQPILPSDQLLTINAFFEPLNFSSLSQNMRHSFLGNLDELHSLKSWTQPFIPRLNLAVRHFKSFLPKKLEIGKPYWIIQGNQQQRVEHLSSNRYYPPDVANENLIFHRLLTMFHLRPFLLCRFPAQGMVAVVRARHGPFLDIYFRLHAEFQLNTPPYHPFWFTPAQFRGRLIIREDVSELTYFRMYVPNDKQLNIDMEWLSDNGGPSASMEVDIGYMPQMELRSAAPSINMNETGTSPDHFVSSMSDKLYETLVNSFSWKDGGDLNEKETFDLLERTFYPFKEVPYYEYRQAFQKAETTNKLVHTIVLWGALDDQSC